MFRQQFLPINGVQKVPGSNPTGCKDILDSIVDFILINFFEFIIKSYKYCEFFSAMENQVCERTSFGAVGGHQCIIKLLAI